MSREFEDALAKLTPENEPFKLALIDVCDTAEMCKKWFDSVGLSYAAADVVALTALVLGREFRA